MPTDPKTPVLATPAEIGKRLAAAIFKQRSRGDNRNVEVHLSEDALAAICEGAAILGRDKLAPAAPAPAHPRAVTERPGVSVEIAPGDKREQAAGLVEAAARYLADSGAVEAAWFLRGVVDGMSDNPDLTGTGGKDSNYRAGLGVGDAAAQHGRGF